MCRTREEAERALVALRTVLSELGLTLKDAKTRIVELREGGEGLDFLGFHHRWVRGNTPASKHLTFLARWPSRQAMQRARGRIGDLTDRRRLREPVEDVVQDVNRFLRGWAGYFRYGNSADAFDKITLHAQTRMAGFVAKRHKQRTRYGWWLLRHHPDQIGLINLNGIVIAPRPQRSRRRGSWMPAVKNVGEPCAGEPNARIEVAAGGNQASRASTYRAAQAPLADPTTPQ